MLNRIVYLYKNGFDIIQSTKSQLQTISSKASESNVNV